MTRISYTALGQRSIRGPLRRRVGGERPHGSIVRCTVQAVVSGLLRGRDESLNDGMRVGSPIPEGINTRSALDSFRPRHYSGGYNDLLEQDPLVRPFEVNVRKDNALLKHEYTLD
jgi:hypothetical protein